MGHPVYSYTLAESLRTELFPHSPEVADVGYPELWVIRQDQFAATVCDGAIARLLEQRGNLGLRGKDKDSPTSAPKSSERCIVLKDCGGIRKKRTEIEVSILARIQYVHGKVSVEVQCRCVLIRAIHDDHVARKIERRYSLRQRTRRQDGRKCDQRGVNTLQ